MRSPFDPLGSALLLAAALLVSGCTDSEPAVAPSMGTLERDRVELVADSFEPIVGIAVREGDAVAPGELLMQLDPRIVDARLVRARASVVEADAALRLAVRGPRDEEIDEGSSRLAGAEGALAAAAQDVERLRRLVAEEIETQSVLDLAQGRYDEALGRRDEARAALDALLEGTTVEELDRARATLATAESALLELDIDRERLEIRAPVGGRVDALPLKLGARPAVGAAVAVLLADGAPYARVHVPAEVWQGLVPGAEAEVRVDGREEAWRGRLRWISSEAAFTPYYALTRYDRGRLSYLAEVDLIEPAAVDLPVGVTVEVKFDAAPEAFAEGE